MNSAHILIIDDEENIRTLVRRTLERQGYSCEEASDAAEAEYRLEMQQGFDLVITDILMPGISGVDFLTGVRSRHPNTAVIMLTGLDRTDLALQCLELGAYGYVVKPFTANELMINVANALRRRDLEKMRDDYAHRLEAEVQERTLEIRRTQEEITMRLLNACEYRDEETGAHIRRMGHYAAALAAACEWDPEHVELMRLAAPMHDVGKIGVPDAVLRKPGKLTEEEFAEIRKHPGIGASILGDSEIPLLKLAREIALSHHEKWDGTGYPQRLAGTNIPQSGRILALCDVYDALVNDRVYRPALPEDQALEIMRDGRGKHFDPACFDVFLDVLDEFRIIRREFQDAALPARLGV